MPFHWGESQQNAFDELKLRLSSAPILAYADYQRPYKVHTDASSSGLGAVLYQTQDNVDRVIAYASRSLRPSERIYPAHKLEFLALKWAATEKFHDYLYGATFDVHTDNNPLTYVLTTTKLDATGQRWLASLANYNFNIYYRSGRSNTDADALSRLHEDRVFPGCVLQAINNSSAISKDNVALAECLVLTHTTDLTFDKPANDEFLKGFGQVNLRHEQAHDPSISRVVNLLSNGQRPTAQQVKLETFEVK